MAKKELTTKKRIETYIQYKNKWLDKTCLKEHYVIEFPTQKKPPFLSRLAISIITSQGGRIGLRLEDKS